MSGSLGSTAMYPASAPPTANQSRASIGGSTVLLGAIDDVRKLIIGGDVIHLGGGLIEPRAPGLPAVQGDVGALVGAQQHAPRFGGVDPQDVIIVAARRAFEDAEGLAAIGGAKQGDVGDEQGVGVVRVHSDIAEIPGALGEALVGAGARPGFAAIFGAVEAAGVLGIDQGVDALAAGRNRNARTAPLAFGQAAASQVRPMLAAISRAVQSAAGAFDGRVLAPGRPFGVPERRIECGGAGSEDEVCRAEIRTFVEDLGPVL